MVDPKLRRVLAASALAAAVLLVPVAGANAAVHRREHRAPVASSRIEAGVAWLWDLVAKALVGDAGVRIDPDGHK